MCSTRLAGNTGRKNDAKNRHLRTIAQLCQAISSQLRYVDNRKKLVKQQYLPTCPYNMVNFGPLAAEIVSLVWGTPANFNGFLFLAALLHSQTAALNIGRHLYSAGPLSCWALAHISSTRNQKASSQRKYNTERTALASCTLPLQKTLTGICRTVETTKREWKMQGGNCRTGKWQAGIWGSGKWRILTGHTAITHSFV